VVQIACDSRPDQATLVPERREELTTEGGLDLTVDTTRVAKTVEKLKRAGIVVSLFLDPDPQQIKLAAEAGADAVELHTGTYAHARGEERCAELARLADAGRAIRAAGMTLHAGHGLDYHNVRPVASIPEMCELNIGHSIVARAVMIGMQQAVREMKALIA
ncbi:MAG: pyridoxine 5'-phosphate synthase, partial [Planctomycetales bacterium]|nr:pyridoxine 5'-phosphate synthase [Planctomycetales bacterium]